MHTRHVGHALNTIAFTPEPYQSYSDDGFSSLITCGGDYISSYTPIVANNTSSQSSQNFVMCDTIKENLNAPIWKLKYTNDGNTCFCSDDSGYIRKYRRMNNQLHYQGIVFQHKGDVQDLDISPYDEFLVTASKDKTVGLITLGSPNHGSTEYCELT
jgi:WD40 repeat protein